jgi:Raf kinase inhibitor-like YbhB/YbcL family protein
MSLTLTTSAFQQEGMIPDKYSKDGGNISPPLSWDGVPENTKSLALIVDDPDAPSGLFVHWLLYAIPPDVTSLDEDRPAREILSNGIRQGRNGFGELGYGGPQPPSGTHRYFFHIFALDNVPDLQPGATREQLDEAMRGHVLEEAQLMGKYEHHEPGSRAA